MTRTYTPINEHDSRCQCGVDQAGHIEGRCPAVDGLAGAKLRSALSSARAAPGLPQPGLGPIEEQCGCTRRAYPPGGLIASSGVRCDFHGALAGAERYAEQVNQGLPGEPPPAAAGALTLILDGEVVGGLPARALRVLAPAPETTVRLVARPEYAPGMSPEDFSRALAELEADGVCRPSNDQVDACATPRAVEFARFSGAKPVEGERIHLVEPAPTTGATSGVYLTDATFELGPGAALVDPDGERYRAELVAIGEFAMPESQDAAGVAEGLAQAAELMNAAGSGPSPNVVTCLHDPPEPNCPFCHLAGWATGLCSAHQVPDPNCATCRGHAPEED
jgi:hypothetical protein